GNVDYEITANAGVDEQYIAKLASLPVDARFSPVIEQPVVIVGKGAITLYGIDVIGAARGESKAFDPADIETSAVISSDLAARLHLKKGDPLELQSRDRTLKFAIQNIAEN